MPKTVAQFLYVLFRFFCTRKGAGTARFAITIATAILLGLIAFTGTVGKWAAQQVWAKLVKIEKSIEATRKEVSEMQTATRIRVSIYDRQFTNLEVSVDEHDREIRELDKRLYRVEGK